MESMNELFRLSLELGKSKEWTLSECENRKEGTKVSSIRQESKIRRRSNAE